MVDNNGRLRLWAPDITKKSSAEVRLYLAAPRPAFIKMRIGAAASDGDMSRLNHDRLDSLGFFVEK